MKLYYTYYIFALNLIPFLYKYMINFYSWLNVFAFVVVLFQNINFDAILKLCTELLTALSTGSSEKYRNIKINFAD